MNAVEASRESVPNEYSGLAPRFWHGMRAGVWWRLMASNRFRISPRRCHIAIGVTAISPFNDLLSLIQRFGYQQKIESTRIERHPVFILGHWRSGTTLLHELLVTNPDFASPNTYQCFAPSHFLVSPCIARYGGFLLPKKRPMDNMAAGWLLPQEDEFALMNLGVPSPYLRIAFPKTQRQYLEYLDFSGVSQQDVQNWTQQFLWFLRALTLCYGGRRLVLKSPPHTGRVGHLIRVFPKARFIHLVRNPIQLFPSTLRLWKSLDRVQSLQVEDNDRKSKQYVVDCMQRMYAGYESSRGSIPENQIIEVRYEDLVAHPKQTVEKIYSHLELGDFSKASELMDPMLVGHSSYQTNRHRTGREWEQEVMNHCRDYAQRYGYE